MRTLYKYLFAFCLLSFCFLSNANTTDNLSLSVDGFLENKGQMMDMEGNSVPFVLFKSEAPGVNLWITEKGMTMQTFQIRKEPLTGKELEDFEAASGDLIGRKKTKKFIDWERIDLTLKNATIKKENIIKEKATQGHNNYFYPHCPDGIYGVKEYQKMTIQNVYPNIDWVIYSTSESFKYDFVVHSGGDYKQIELVYHSKEPIQINEQGQLVFTTNYGNLQENKPISFYEDKEIKTQFAQNYQHTKPINGDIGYETSISFNFPQTFKPTIQSSNLIIDPQLVWGTLYGGNNWDGFMSMETDNNDNLFITGYLKSSNFPTQNSGSYFQGTLGGQDDVFILKFDNAGNRLWATYYGGSGVEEGYSITTDNNENVYVTGWTQSTNFPVQDAGTFFQGTHSGGTWDAFILKFNNAGNRIWATYYGGSGDEKGYSVTTDHTDNVFVIGGVNSSDFPLQNAGAFFQGSIGGGADIFILKFDNAGNRLLASYYGGNGNEEGYSAAIDYLGNLIITGRTESTNFPTQNSGSYFQGTHGGGAVDVFILKFDNLGNRLWATYYGGNGYEEGYSIATDNIGNVFITGWTQSINFPVQNAGTFFQGTYGGGNSDVFILKFDNTGNRLWATYYGGGSGGGGSGIEDMQDYDVIAIDQCNNVYIGFRTTSTNITTQASGGPSDYNDNTLDFYIIPTSVPPSDNFITQFDNEGNLLWASYIQGNRVDFRNPLAIDSQNNLFVGGEFTSYTSSSTLPMLNPGGGAYFDNTPNGDDDSYILKFSTYSFVAPIFSQNQVNSLACTPCNGEATATIINSATPPFNYEWSTGNQTLNTTDTFNTLTGLCAGNYWVKISSGCNQVDSLFFNITGLTVSTFTQNPSICEGDSVVVGTSVYKTTGIFLDTLFGAAANGCDSIITTNLTVASIDNTTYASNDTIMANQSGASYQWLDCDNGNALINGEISQSFIPTVTGNYAVEITIGSCVDTSACENITGVGVKEIANNKVSIYPNPTKGIFTINLNNQQGGLNYTLTTLEGRIVKQENNVTTNNLEIDLTNESNGIYLLRINEANTNKVYRIVRQ